MGVSLWLPLSTSRAITSNMISPPLSPDFNFDSEALTPSTLPALEYISGKLQQKSLHVTLLVGRGQPVPTTSEAADLMVIPVTQLDPQAWKVFYKIVEKGAKRFSLGMGWTNALDQHSRQHHPRNEPLVEQSIRQNEILFSQEGLTILNVDRIYTFKRRLCMLAIAQAKAIQNPKSTPSSEEKCIASCVQLLHKTITSCQGRPFSFGFFHRAYEHLHVSDELLGKVASAYKSHYGRAGIVIATPKSSPTYPRAHVAEKDKFPATRKDGVPVIRKEGVRKMPVIYTTSTSGAGVGTRGHRPNMSSSSSSSRHRRVPSRVPSRSGTPRRGPTTPVSASDVTPITRNEWNILIGPEFWQNKPTVTMWVPTPEVPVLS